MRITELKSNETFLWLENQHQLLNRRKEMKDIQIMYVKTDFIFCPVEHRGVGVLHTVGTIVGILCVCKRV